MSCAEHFECAIKASPFGDAELVADRAGLLLGGLGLQRNANDRRRLMLALDAVAYDLAMRTAHALELQSAQVAEPALARTRTL